MDISVRLNNSMDSCNVGVTECDVISLLPAHTTEYLEVTINGTKSFLLFKIVTLSSVLKNKTVFTLLLFTIVYKSPRFVEWIFLCQCNSS